MMNRGKGGTSTRGSLDGTVVFPLDAVVFGVKIFGYEDLLFGSVGMAITGLGAKFYAQSAFKVILLVYDGLRLSSLIVSLNY